ncbi:hypothetical protein OAG56_00130 [Mariniblastus sp.]|nr:hypothetical protein [Mariniblastus sp.]MDB4755748.1 hypothetical protein [Mariniblastus sp.]
MKDYARQCCWMMAKRRWRSGHRLELMIRQVLFIFASVIAVCSSGCQWLRWATPNVEAPPGVFNQSASKEEIIQRVNANSQAIRSLQAKIHVRATGTPTLSGDLTIEQPSRLRLQAGLLNMNNSGIDLGSNDNEFWVWLKTPMPGQQPAVLHARHDEYAISSAKKMLPIEPAWIIDSMGLAYFDPRAEHSGPFMRPEGSLEIRSRYQSASGTMLKTTIVDPRTNVVIGQELYQSNIKIASSRARRHQFFSQWNASVPQQVEIEVGMNTATPGKVVIDLSRIRPNSIDGSYAGLWQMPRPRNINMIDIAKQGTPLAGMNETSIAKQIPNPAAANLNNSLGPGRQFQRLRGEGDLPPPPTQAPINTPALPNPYRESRSAPYQGADVGLQNATYNQFEYSTPNVRGFGLNRSGQPPLE